MIWVLPEYRDWWDSRKSLYPNLCRTYQDIDVRVADEGYGPFCTVGLEGGGRVWGFKEARDRDRFAAKYFAEPV